VDRLGTRAHADGVTHTDMRCKGLLKGAQLAAEDKPAAGQNPVHGGIDLTFYRQVMPGQITEWYLHGHFHTIYSR